MLFKKVSLKSTFCGFMAGVMVAVGVPAAAKNAEETINVVYRNIKIYADGQAVDTTDSEAFIYNGTTYLPVRKIGDAFNKAIDWDASTSTVYIGTKPTVSTQPTVLLEDMDYFTSSYTEIHDLSSSGKDNTGNTHATGVEYRYPGSVEYLLNGKYRIFSGTIGICYDLRSTSSEKTVKIYGDGKLLYSSPILTGGVMPQAFNVNVTGVLSLVIEVDGGVDDLHPQFYDAGFYS